MRVVRAPILFRGAVRGTDEGTGTALVRGRRGVASGFDISVRLDRPARAERGRAVALVGRAVLSGMSLLTGPNTPLFGVVAKYCHPSIVPSFFPWP